MQEFVFDLKNQRTRLVLTLISIIWGTMSVVLLLAFGFGLEKRMREGQMNARDAVVSIWSGETSKKFQGLGLGRNIYMHKEDIALLKDNIPLVDLISPSFGKGVRVRKGENRTTTYAEGVSVDFKEMRHMFPQSGGRFLNENDIRRSRRVVFIGDELALTLFGDEEPVGAEIFVDDTPYTVVGVMQPKLQTSMSNGPDADRVIIPYTTFSTAYQRRRINHMIVRPSVKSGSKDLIRDIRYILGKKYRFDPTDKYALSVWDDIEMEKIASKIFLGLNIFFGVIGALTLVIAGVGVANIMYVVVKERTRELGIRRAAGAKRKHIVYHFVGEAFLITGGGGVLGIIFSLGVIGLASLIPIDSGVMKYMGHPIFSWQIAVVTVIILVLIALLSGIFPARQAADIEPVEALRYE
ncbi:MAG TPA: ABC transporter permease [Candidatus Krumholzibacteriaceae bacterium]|nr:ABC transporter permease [Candidatus Krumholzibacteriaceae bacterium]